MNDTVTVYCDTCNAPIEVESGFCEEVECIGHQCEECRS